jgi:hypothetical protein
MDVASSSISCDYAVLQDGSHKVERKMFVDDEGITVIILKCSLHAFGAYKYQQWS